MRRLIFLLLLVGLLAPAVFARDDHEEARRLREAGEILPLETVLEHARLAQPGKVLEVKLELELEHGGYVYEFEVLDDAGVLWELELDARDGTVLEHKRD